MQANSQPYPTGAHVKRLAAFLSLATILLAAGAAQEILTADQFFAQVTERYATVNDYEGQIQISAGKSLMTGTIAWRTPSFLRIDFSNPAEQVIAFDGETLVVYIPEYRAILQQSAASAAVGTGANQASLATREGLKMMKRSYTIAYESSPAPVALDPASQEMVVRLVLSRRTVAEGFTTIYLSIDPSTLLIRRMEGLTLAKERIVFDFSGIKTNQGIPEARFIYDSPPSANVYNNFLFGSDN
jgi:outer membrane lipoprotein-sorting protein